MKIRSISLPEELDQQAAAAVHRDGHGRNYSSWAREVIERAVTGANRLADLEDIAEHEVEAATKLRELGPNPGAVIADESLDGRQRLTRYPPAHREGAPSEGAHRGGRRDRPILDERSRDESRYGRNRPVAAVRDRPLGDSPLYGDTQCAL
jgi:hypothetical protein